LSYVNNYGVDDKEGEKIGLGTSGPIAGTTNTATTDRTTTDIASLDSDTYNCTQTNYDTHITYAKLDQWAKFKDFQARLRDAIMRQHALDRITIGFNGTSRAATSNKATNPLLQDVNVGWLQKYRANAPARVMSEVVAASGAVNVYHGGDYENLDALVYDAVSSLIEPWHAESTELMVLCGRALLADKYFPILNQQDSARPPSEQLAGQVLLSAKKIGGLPAMRVPYFPANAMLIAIVAPGGNSNLSIYYQNGARRRNVIDNPKRDRIENYESSNDAFIVEDYGAGCLIENINLTAPPAGP
jgi:P2 family phage major capsid protein